MSQGFFERLEARVAEVDSLLCVGLAPHPEELPAPTAEAARAFCLRLVEATSHLAAAFKPNAAFFEAFGPDGFAIRSTGVVHVQAPLSVTAFWFDPVRDPAGSSFTGNAIR